MITIPQNPSKKELTEICKTIFSWILKDTPVYTKSNNKEWKNYWEGNKILENLFFSESSLTPLPWNQEETNTVFSPYFNFLTEKIKENYYHPLKIIWDAYLHGQEPVKKAFSIWLAQMENEKYVEVYFEKNIIQAIELNKFIEKKGLKAVSKKDFYQWIDLLDHENPILRTNAAKCLGETYLDFIEPDEFDGHQEISLVNMLALLKRKQQEGKNVLGAFINGVCYEGHLQQLKNHPNLQNTRFALDKYLIETAINSTEYEPDTPGSQSFWFYLHEYFDFNPKALHQLLDGKRFWLAMMCATESMYYGSFEIMLPIFERLQKEAPQNIKKETKRQLDIYYSKNKK